MDVKFKDSVEKYSNLEVVQAPALALEYGSEPALALDHGFDDPKNLPEVVPQPEEQDSTKDNQLNSKDQRTILGLRYKTFWVIAAVCATIIIAGAVGGGIAGSNAAKGTHAPNQRDQKSPSTSHFSLPPSSASSAVTSGTTGIAANSCNSPNAWTYRTSSGQKFLVLCFVDMPRGHPGFTGDGLVADVNRTITYTLEECMDYCETYNKNNPPKKCAAVTYNANLTSSVAGQDGNCFLKDRRGIAISSDSLVASASTAE